MAMPFDMSLSLFEELSEFIPFTDRNWLQIDLLFIDLLQFHVKVVSMKLSIAIAIAITIPH